MFSADGKLIYGIRAAGDRNEFFSVDIATSLSPDGKSFIYSISKTKSNLWMLEGFEPISGLLTRFFRAGIR